MTAEATHQGRSLKTLDWMRGIAALCVMFYHYFQHTKLNFLFSWSFIAVDFFFMLSGFVLAYRYGSQIPHSFGSLKFIRIRLVRLYPLYIVGTAIGAAAALIDIHLGRTHGFGIRQWEVSAALASVFLPYLGNFDFSAGAGIISSPNFPLDVPAWSLFFELLANILLACFVFNVRRLTAILIASLVALVWADLHYHSENVGWGITVFVGGLPRVAFCFFVGVLLENVWRAGWAAKFAVSPFLLALLLTIDLLIPTVPHFGIIHYLVSILLLFPGIILFSARSTSEGVVADGLQFLGRISYALYAVHYPVLQFSDLLVRATGIVLNRPIQIGVTLATSVVALGLAAALTIWIDEPIRRAFAKALRRRIADRASAAKSLDRCQLTSPR